MTGPWPMVPLGEVVTHRKQFIHIDDTRHYKRCRVQLHAGGIVLRDEVPGLEIKTKKQQVSRPGDFLVAEIDAKHGGYGIVPPELDGAVVSSHYFLFEIDESKLDRRFLGWFVKTPAFAEQVEAQGSTNYAAIRPAHVLAYRLPLPPVGEQRRIVARVDALAAKIAEARGLASSSAGLAGQLPESETHEAMNWDGHPAVPLVELLAEATLNGLGVTPSDTPPGVRILRISAGTSRRDAYVDENDTRFADVPAADAEKYRLRPGDLLACRFNGNLHYVGRFSLFAGTGPGIRLYPDKLIRFRLDPSKALPEYVCLAMNSRRGREQVESLCETTAGNIGVSASALRAVPIPLMPLRMQGDLVRHIAAIRAKATAITAVHAATAAELSALLPSVLSRAFRGEL